MSLGLALYRMATHGLTPFVPGILTGRETKGKEPGGRRDERLARNLPSRPPGRLVWMHGASLGETKLLYSLCEAMQAQAPDLNFLVTSQTVTAAELALSALPERAIHQMAPVDVPTIARRFVAHWKPDLCIFAEGEVWPNLLSAASRSEARLALVNARMTARTFAGWKRWPGSARDVFNRFNLVLAADTYTAKNLNELTGREIASFGTLKAGPGQAICRTDEPAMSMPWGDGSVLLGASTHEGEEALLLDALSALPRDARLILAPRHPARGDAVEALVRSRNVPLARRSRNDAVSRDTCVLLADTVGEMGKWYTLADHVYLGGAHRSGIGGHNPLEPLAAGKPVICGPYMTNFTDVAAELSAIGALQTASDAAEIVRLCNEPAATDKAAIRAYFKAGAARLEEATNRLLGLLPAKDLS